MIYQQGTSRTNGSVVYEINPLSNPNISWEKANKLNIGTDIALFNNRLSLTADFYRDYYYDLLQSRGKSIELIGMSYPTENIGEALMNGLELALTYRDYAGDFHYYITANWSQERSELLYMDEQDYAGENCRHTGKPLTSIFGLVADGFFTSEEEIQSAPIVAGYDRKNIRPGDIKYKNLNGDNVIDQYDQTLIGGDKPISYFGLDLGFEYKGFEVSAMLQGVYNWDRYMYDATLMSGFQSVNQGYGQAYETVLNRWTPETAATATLPRLSAGGNEYNSQPNGLWTSLWIQSCNYIRLRNLSVGYTFPETLSRNYLAGLKIKLFVAGQNLWTQSAYAYGDPEVGFDSYPLMRTFYTGINIKF
ncbi:MAG: TonB-dependent receptor [Dysgonamonadaceae bacterium]|jgi:hypothetical protein|nr:TonB-dependent receptor [Dysgonamonadaceae bacterium]